MGSLNGTVGLLKEALEAAGRGEERLKKQLERMRIAHRIELMACMCLSLALSTFLATHCMAVRKERARRAKRAAAFAAGSASASSSSSRRRQRHHRHQIHPHLLGSGASSAGGHSASSLGAHRHLSRQPSTGGWSAASGHTPDLSPAPMSPEMSGVSGGAGGGGGGVLPPPARLQTLE